jgi:hypothetical protein
MTFEEYKITDEASDLLEKLKRKLKQREFDISEYSDDDLFDEIEDAIEAVNSRRHFIPTESKIFEDKYKGIVIRLCICSFSKMGAEGELAHSENNISRTYAGASEYPNDILKEVVPLGRIKSL